MIVFVAILLSITIFILYKSKDEVDRIIAYILLAIIVFVLFVSWYGGILL